MVTLPPEGAARQVGGHLWQALCGSLPTERRKLFDTKVYQDGFDRLLKDPSDEMVVDLLNQALVVQALDLGATHVLVLALSPVTAFTADLLKRRGLITIHWFYEDFRQAGYWDKVLPAYSHFLALQRGPVEAACAAGGVRFHYLPTAAMPAAPEPKAWPGRGLGILFVGYPSPYRIRVLEALATAGLPLVVAGSGWESYRGPLDACLKSRKWTGADVSRALLEDAKVGLHIPSEDPESDRENTHVSPRVFDILAAGAVLVCEEAPLIRETLRGMAWREFRGPGEAVEACRLSLAAGLRDEALRSNRETALREHGYARRVDFLMNLE